MVQSFGYMTHAYVGPYPSEVEATAAFSGALRAEWDTKNEELLHFASSEFHIEPDGRLRYFYNDHHPGSFAYCALLWQTDCLILFELPWQRTGVNVPVRTSLIDVKTGRRFATYDLTLSWKELPRPQQRMP